ncbi:putative F420-0 ABC transporter permease subunit [Nesterenkonia haasae]|uniref:putative F420-0 ABC transporter permease subunit n=1 Tax=Nesterenkonia haasae TaxID=2587813 RepID=UPI001F266192|nr:putative F420-0 ABC transporter permease subunit [Nesterenkonia haasae]
MFLTIALAIEMLAAIVIGPANISVHDVGVSMIAHVTNTDASLSVTQEAIMWELRMPRIVTAMFVGAGLAVCGTVMQASTRNPLADPYLLGLSSGASLGAVLVIVVGLTITLPVAAFFGSILALTGTLILASVGGPASPSRTVLAGVAISSLFSAMTSLVIFWSSTGDTYREILGWLLGSLAGTTWNSVLIAAIAFLTIGVPLVLSANTLNAFAFGDRTARSLGVHATTARILLLGASAVLTGALVSVSGSIGFIGLLVPHATRLLTGPDHRRLLPVAALAGALLLLLADTIARVAFDPRELPVGIVTAILGAPAFAILLLRSRRAL